MSGDPKKGEKIFKTKCAQCHSVDPVYHWFEYFMYVG